MEVGSRFLFPEWAPISSDRNFWAYDPLLGWSGVPFSKGRMEYLDFDVDVAISSAGLRDSEYPVARVPGKKRMLVLGDSFGWGFGVEKDEIWLEQIEIENQDWEVINASVSGYGTDQEYLYYLTRGRRYKPDVVLLLFYGGNDVTNSSSSSQYWHNKPLFVLSDEGGIDLTGVPVPPLTVTQEVANFVSSHTYFLRMASSLVRARGAALEGLQKPSEEGLTKGSFEKISQGAKGQNLSDNEERVVRLILALREVVQEDGAQLVVAYTPGKTKIFEEPRLLDAGLNLFSLADVFNGIQEPVIFEHDSHWNPLGHKIVGEKIHDHLRRIGVFEDTLVGSP